MRFLIILYLILFSQFNVFAERIAALPADTTVGLINSDTAQAIKTDTATKQAKIDIPDAQQRTRATEVWVFIACCVTFFFSRT